METDEEFDAAWQSAWRRHGEYLRSLELYQAIPQQRRCAYCTGLMAPRDEGSVHEACVWRVNRRMTMSHKVHWSLVKVLRVKDRSIVTEQL
jgi:hypothetical protein